MASSYVRDGDNATVNWTTLSEGFNASEHDQNLTSPSGADYIPWFTIPKEIQVLMSVMYIAIIIAAVGGNGIVCYIVLAYQRMRTVTNFFIVNLAVGDIMMAVLCIPFTFVANLVVFYWPFGSIMCPVVSYVQAVTVFISAYTLIAISIDRYVAILYPLRPRMSKLQAKIIIFLVWVVALVTPLPTAVLSRSNPMTNLSDYYVCTEMWETSEHRYYYSMALMILQYFFPLSVLIFTYTRIAIVVWGKRAPGEAEDNRDQRLAASKRKMLRMMITVVIIFTLCWLPMNTLIVVGDLDSKIWTYENVSYVWFACHWLAMSHACYNPAIYCWMNIRFRRGFQRIFYCCKCLQADGLFTESGSLRRCNTFATTYTSVRTLSARSTRNGNVRLSSTPSEMTMIRRGTNGYNHHTQHPQHYHCYHAKRMIEDDPTSESHF